MTQLRLFEEAVAIDPPATDDISIAAIEAEISRVQSVMDFEVHEYNIDFVLKKFLDGVEDEENEIYIPDYQRDLVWLPKQQARFIESVFLGLPIPFIFVADTQDGDDRAGHLEIVDGVQRLKTLANWASGNLILRDLTRIPSLNGKRFTDLPKKLRLRFLRRSLRLIQINEKANSDMRRELFDRLNSGGSKLLDMEQRRGTSDGPFLDFIEECAGNEQFRRLCPLPPRKVIRREYEELVLRFFAYLDRYGEFTHDVAKFLDAYLRDRNANFDRDRMLGEFEGMLAFVARNFPSGFAKNGNHVSVPRVRFEAIAIGVALALRENPRLPDANSIDWLNSNQFSKETTSHASNSGPRLRSRLFFVRDSLLGRPPVVEEESAEDSQFELA